MNGYNRLEWGNTCDLDITLYQQGFKQWMYIDCDPSLPEYEREDDGFVDGYTDNIRTFSRMAKRMQMQFVAPEFLLDAITLIPLHDSIFLYTRDGETWRLTEVATDIEWIEGDCLSVCTMTFLADLLDVRNCCEDITRCVDVTMGDVIDCVDITDAKYTDPIGEGIAQDSIYFFWTVSENNGYLLTGNIYQLRLGEWVLVPTVDGDAFNNETTGVNFQLNAGKWNAYPIIHTVTSEGGYDWKFEGYMPPNTWVDVYSDIGAGYVWVAQMTANDFNNEGLVVTVTPPLITRFKFYAYNHSCIYGYSNVITFDPPCNYEFLLNNEFDNGPLNTPGAVLDWVTDRFAIINYGVYGRVANSNLRNEHLEQTISLQAGYTYILMFEGLNYGGANSWQLESLDDGFLIPDGTFALSGGEYIMNCSSTWSAADTNNPIPSTTGKVFRATVDFTPTADSQITLRLDNSMFVDASMFITYASIERDCN